MISGNSYKLPSYKTVSGPMLDELHSAIERKIKSELEEVESCSITTDGWTSVQTFGFMSLTVHHVDNMFMQHSRTLAIENITGPHTGEVLQSSIKDLLEQWNILKKVESTTTDNGK